jgi:protein-disulfide isomerase
MPSSRRRLGALVAAGLAVLAGGSLSGRGAGAAETSEHVIGDPNAPVTIVEYASLSCSHCATFHTQTLPGLKERYIDTGKVKLVFRDFPLEENALTAATLARCAGPERQGRFVDVYFRQQQSWAGARDPQAAIRQLAKLGGMSEEAIEACLGDRAAQDAVLQSRLEGQQRHGVKSTPSFVIGGKTYAGARTVDEFAEIIDPLLP